jgi:hypothetical protein
MDTKWDAADYSKKGEFGKLRSIQNGRTLRNVYLDEFSLHPMRSGHGRKSNNASKENYKERLRKHFQN